MHPKTLHGLCSYAQIPPKIEMSLVSEAAAAQRSQQHQVVVQAKALYAHLKLQVAFPVGNIAKFKAVFSLGIFQIGTPAWIFQPGSYFSKKAAYHCVSQYCSVFAQPHHVLTHQPYSPQH